MSGEGEPQVVANADEASQLAGIPVRLPKEATGSPVLEVTVSDTDEL